ncbi:MAG: hypothetical protein FWG36_10605 [Oscillospiraceae bacterium]|nr:hypothetical protein [Oscillospiraceae bacterium]
MGYFYFTQHQVTAFAALEVSHGSLPHRTNLPGLPLWAIRLRFYQREYHYHRRAFGLRLSPALAPITGGRGARRGRFTVPGAVVMTAEAVFVKEQVRGEKYPLVSKPIFRGCCTPCSQKI